MLNRLHLFITLLLLTPSHLYGQSNGNTTKPLPEFREPGYKSDRDVNGSGTELDIDKWVEETTDDIIKARPGAFTSNPNADRAVVRSVYKSLKTKRADLGFSGVALLKSLFSAWIDLAVKGFDKTGKEVNYTEQDLLDKALNMSELSIKTTPEGATIKIDSYNGYGNTNTYIWVTGGTHVLEIEKAGYVTIKQTLPVKLPRLLPLDITLQRVKQ